MKYSFKILVLTCLCMSCTYYKTIMVSNPTPEAISILSQRKSIRTVQNSTNLPIVINEFNTTDSSVIGVKGGTKLLFHKSNDDSFLKRKNKTALMYLHYFTPNLELRAEELDIDFSEVKEMRYHEVNLGESIFASLGLSAATASVIVLGSTALATRRAVNSVDDSCNCPYVDMIDESGESHFQGTLFPGAIFKSLERTDFLVINSNSIEDVLHVRISNNLPEKEFINQVDLARYEVSKTERLAINEFGKLVAVSSVVPPIEATSFLKQSRTDELSQVDHEVYRFDEAPKRDQFNYVDLKFPIDQSKEAFNLIVRAKQSEWLEVVADKLFYMFGNKFDRWVEKMDNANPEKHRSWAIDQGLRLRVLVKIKGKWELTKAFYSAGTKSYRDMVVTIPANEGYGKELEVRLESGYRFWEVDQVALAANSRTNLSYKKVTLLSAISNNGDNSLNSLKEKDIDYATILNKGDFIDLHFNNAQSNSEKTNTLVLSGTGYYHHQRVYDHNADMKGLRTMKKPLGVHQLSQIIELAEIVARSNFDD